MRRASLVRSLTALAIFAALASAFTAVAMTGGPVYAEHETRPAVLQDVGLNVVVLAGTIALIVLSIVAFAIIVLRWEGLDEEGKSSARAPDGELAGQEREATRRD